MTRRDQNSNNQQAGGYRSEDAWDSPRQASQWSENDRQTGDGWDQDDNQRTAYRQNGNRDAEGRYGQNRQDGRQDNRHRDDWQDRDYDGVSPGAHGQGLRDDEESYRPYGRNPQSRGGYGSDRSGTGRYSVDQYDRHFDRGNRDFASDEQRYRSRGAAHLPHSYDSGYGRDFSSFTGDDYGGRDFSANRGGVTGGARSSDSYRPSFGPGSGDRDSNPSRKEYGDWRQYGESRGFFEKAGDEIASWFGDEDATRRREEDHRGRGPSDYTRSDERIREDINDKLTHDWRVDASHIRVTVKEGEVSLDGSVSSREAKRRAEDVADDITGVRHVQNNLRVENASQQRGSATGVAGSTAAAPSTTGSTAAGSTGSYSSSTDASPTATTGARSTDKTA